MLVVLAVQTPSSHLVPGHVTNVTVDYANEGIDTLSILVSSYILGTYIQLLRPKPRIWLTAKESYELCEVTSQSLGLAMRG